MEIRFHFQDTPKWNSVSISETLRNGILFPFPRHSKMEFRVHFQDTPKRNSISVSGLHYSINPNTLFPITALIGTGTAPAGMA
jgi:hypothetical protein